MKGHSLDAADRLVRQVEEAGLRLEPRGEHIWASKTPPAELAGRIQAHRAEVLRYLRLRAVDRLTASARTLARFLDDTEADLEARRPRLPEYEELLAQIAELQPFIGAYEEEG